MNLYNGNVGPIVKVYKIPKPIKAPIYGPVRVPAAPVPVRKPVLV